MNLESLILEVRPRTPWESMDLSVRLVMDHWRVLFISWMVTVFPLFLIINVILLQDYPMWTFFLVWFLKPLYDRVPLFVLSRVIFSEQISWRDVIAAIPSFFRTGILASLTFYRLDPGRAFSLPVRQLEGLKGKRRRQRLLTLRRGRSNREVMLFILCFHLESLFTWGVVGTVLMMLPAHLAMENAQALFMDQEPGLLMNALSMLVYFFIMMSIETFYVAGGFVLYLNRRIILEGWDIELTFKQLKQRHDSADKEYSGAGKKTFSVISMTGIIALLLMNLTGTNAAYAASYTMTPSYESILPPVNQKPLAPELSENVIKDVMNDPVFNRTRTVEYLEYLGPEKKQEKKDIDSVWLTDVFEVIGNTIAFIFEIGLWILLLIAAYFIIKNHDRLQLAFWRRKKTVPAEVPEMLFGLDLREESLPDDVTAQALQLLHAHQYREALALLYRATLSYLVKNYNFSLGKGATEGDCLRWVTKELSLLNKAQVNYFVELTRAWQLTAYAHREIAEDKMEALCRNWSKYYEQDKGLLDKDQTRDVSSE